MLLDKMNKHNWLVYFTFAIGVTINLLFSPHTLAYWANGDYLPNLQYGTIFSQTCVIQNILDSKNLVVNGVSYEFNTDKNELLISGKSNAGKHWSLQVNAGGGGSVWQSDLDNNGETDLLVLLGIGACGNAPTARLAFLMFDKDHMPKSWLITGYFVSGRHGIEDIRKFPGIKNAALIEQVLASDLSAKKNYWRTSMWRAKSEGWVLLKQAGNMQLPTYTLYTNKTNHKISLLKRIPVVYQADDVAIQPAQKALSAPEKFVGN